MFTQAAAIDRLDTSDEINALRRQLAVRGIFVRVGRNFQDFIGHIARCPERASVHEQFDPEGDMDGAVDAFWLCAFDQDGDLVLTQAAHLLDLRQSSIAHHIEQNIANFRPKKPPLLHSTITAKAGPNGRRIRGMVAYHGEMWLQKRFRDQSTASLAIRLGILLIAREWNPDAIFGLMSWSLAIRGFNMRIGYTHSEPMALTWERADRDARHQVWLVYLERGDISFLRQLPAVEFASVLAREFEIPA